ncbi:MAG: hypothetical protein K6G44_14075 [Lentisphaeria bacterium]|nr:hypothetical protein [Lentisphaeria bacterium]
MCYYLGIEDLAANALIAAMQVHREPLFFSFETLEKYGAQVIRYLKKAGKEALLILSRDHTDAFFKEYSAFFRKTTRNGEDGVALCEGVEAVTLVRAFQGYLPLELLLAFISPDSTKILGLTA